MFLGDVFHHNERVHYSPLAEFTETLTRIRELIPHIIIIAGNHDMANNQQFMVQKGTVLSAFGAMEHVDLVEEARLITISHKRHGRRNKEDATLLCVPYVPPGRFDEAVHSVLRGKHPRAMNVSLVLAHQTITGCLTTTTGGHIGPRSVTHGDGWPVDYPPMISGHIHEQQTVGQNVLYPGCSLPTERDVHTVDDMARIGFFTCGGPNVMHIVQLCDVPTSRTIVLPASVCTQSMETSTDPTIRSFVAHVSRPGNSDDYTIRIEHDSSAAMHAFDILPLVSQFRSIGKHVRVCPRLRLQSNEKSMAANTTRKRGGASLITCTADLIRDFQAKDKELAQQIKERATSSATHTVCLRCAEIPDEVPVSAEAILGVYTDRFLRRATSSEDDHAIIATFNAAVCNIIR